MKRAPGARVRCVLPLLALAGTSFASSVASPALAQSSPLPERMRVSVQPCAALPFDAEAYLGALRVELVALGVAVVEPAAPEVNAAVLEAPGPQPAPIPELSLSSPECDERLQLRLQLGAETRDTSLQTGELPALGRERALALLSVERLQLAWPTLSAQPNAPTSAPAPNTPNVSPKAAPGAQPKSARDAGARRARGEQLTLGQGALSAGLRFSAAAPLASLGLTLDRSFSRRLALGGALAWRSENEHLADATDAHSLTAGPRLELSLLELGGVELTAALGLVAGVAWVITERSGASEARVSSSPAALGLATGMLGVRATLAWELFLQTGLAVDYALLGARFESAGGRRLAELTGARFAAFVGMGARLGG